MPISSNCVLKMNMKGRTAVRIEYRNAVTPVFIRIARGDTAAA